MVKVAQGVVRTYLEQYGVVASRHDAAFQPSASVEAASFGNSGSHVSGVLESHLPGVLEAP